MVTDKTPFHRGEGWGGVYLITGGQRSGKSVYAEQLALSLSPNPVYMATAHVGDEEFRQRVQVHQQRRGPQWTNIEEERTLSRHDVTGRVVLIDCCTLWATNYFFTTEDDDPDRVQKAIAALREEFDRFTAQDATFIFVTNEIGLGGVSPNKVQRQFADLLGLLNQYIAARADHVTMLVSGIPVEIKAVPTPKPSLTGEGDRWPRPRNLESSKPQITE